MSDQIATMKLLPSPDIMECINELLQELQSRQHYVIDHDNPEWQLDRIEYHEAEGWLNGEATPAVGDGSDNLYCFFKEVPEC